MKTQRTTSSYPYSSSYYQNLWENFAFGLEESSNQENKSTKTHYPKIVQRENGRCEICYEIAKNKMKGSSELQNGKEEDKQEVVEENVIVIIDDNKEKRKEPLEKKVNGIGEIKGKKMDVMEENVVLGMEKDEANKVKRKKLEEIMLENGEVEEGKIVIIDDGVDMETLLGDNDARESGNKGNDNGERVVEDLMEVQNVDMFSAEINGEGNQFPSWNQWKFEAEQEWYCSYPFWETENGALNFCDAEPPTNDWVVSLWQL